MLSGIYDPVFHSGTGGRSDLRHVSGLSGLRQALRICIRHKFSQIFPLTLFEKMLIQQEFSGRRLQIGTGYNVQSIEYISIFNMTAV